MHTPRYTCSLLSCFPPSYSCYKQKKKRKTKQNNKKTLSFPGIGRKHLYSILSSVGKQLHFYFKPGGTWYYILLVNSTTVSGNIVIRTAPRSQRIENRVLRVLFIGEVCLKRWRLERKGSIADQTPDMEDLTKTFGYPAAINTT